MEELSLGDLLLLRRHGEAPRLAAPSQRLKPSQSAVPRALRTTIDAPKELETRVTGSDDDASIAGKKRRRNKHAPAEQSSSVPVGRFRRVIEVPHIERRDPRFDVTSGAFNEEAFRNAYGFLNEYREEEIRQLRAATAAAAAVGDDDERSTAQAALSRLMQQRTEDARKAAAREAVRSHKSIVAERVAQGHKPYFPKRRELKELAAAAQFSKLEAKGGAAAVDRALAKRRKKLAGRSKASLPPPSRLAAVADGAGS